MSDDRDRDFEMIKRWRKWEGAKPADLDDEIKRFLTKHVSNVPAFRYTREELLDHLADCLPHLPPTTAVHEEVVEVLHDERLFVCKCGYCPKPGKDD